MSILSIKMASMSLAPAIKPEHGSSPGPPRHVRKHSRYPTAAAPLPSFSFNPGNPSQEENVESENKENVSMVGSGHIRRPSKPLPLPDFSFNPGADLPVEKVPSPTHPILEEMALNQQRVSKSAKPAPLPAFTFNPGGSGANSPTKLEVDGERSVVGHRRGHSEFVGGKADGAQLVATSPSKQDSRSIGPPVSASGHGFRGHTHRRSQAISVSDIDTSDLIKQHALAKARAPSQPSTPQESAFSFPKPGPGHRYTASAARSPPGSPRRGASISSYRPRTVDFSEKVQVIPRPLSMISSETERSNSTIRGHSLSNSINSIASPGHPTEEALSTSMPHGDSIFNRRPNTADAALLLSKTDSIKDVDLLSMPKRPLSASNSPMLSTSGSPPLKKKHFWSAYGNESTPSPTPKEECNDPFESMSTSMTAVPSESHIRPKTAPERPSTHKRRKYHTWTAGIFSKKSKHRSSKKTKRTPTPPAMLRRDSDGLNEIFDTDDTIVLREDSPVATRTQSVTTPRDISFIMAPPSFDGPGQVIDLDAAFDPFTDDRRHSEDQSRSTTARIAKLHSSERRTVVDAFGVSHRRTESAPALSPVNRSGLFGMRSQGSNASLGEEVFDEQEEDNFLAHEEETKSHSAHHSSEALAQPIPRRQEDGLGLSNLSETVDSVVIVDVDADTEESRSSKSTIEAPVLLADDLPKRPATSPMAFAYPDPQLHYASSTEGRTTSASLISSPDVENMSFDMQTRHRRFGDHNIDSLRPSTDDLPSLSDSASSHVIPRASCSANVRPSLDHRSNSMFVPGSAKVSENWKRSSLASLNRLIPGSSHGSKLRLEDTATPADEKVKKKSNRISKLMKFWRSKEVDDKHDS